MVFSLGAKTLIPLALRACPITATVCLPPSPTQTYEHLAIALGATLAVGIGLALFVRKKIRVEEPVGKSVKARKRAQ